MGIWTCGRCDADFSDKQAMWEHAREVHGERAPQDPKWPTNAPVKPLGAKTPAPEAQALRQHHAGAMKERETYADELEDARPTSLRHDKKPPKGRGRPPPRG